MGEDQSTFPLIIPYTTSFVLRRLFFEPPIVVAWTSARDYAGNTYIGIVHC